MCLVDVASMLCEVCRMFSLVGYKCLPLRQIFSSVATWFRLLITVWLRKVVSKVVSLPPSSSSTYIRYYSCYLLPSFWHQVVFTSICFYIKEVLLQSIFQTGLITTWFLMPLSFPTLQFFQFWTPCRFSTNQHLTQTQSLHRVVLSFYANQQGQQWATWFRGFNATVSRQVLRKYISWW